MTHVKSIYKKQYNNTNKTNKNHLFDSFNLFVKILKSTSPSGGKTFFRKCVYY